jgi:hypothetical protein
VFFSKSYSVEVNKVGTTEALNRVKTDERDGVAIPFAGIIRIRFDGYDLSLSGTP